MLLETATDICSVAVATDGQLVSIRETVRSFSHSEVITVYIDQCLQEAGLMPSDLSAVAVTSGPGSYTALRIGTSTAKGMCYALDLPLISVDTLRSMAVGLQGLMSSGDIVIPLLDARRMEVYRAVYDARLQELEPVCPVILDEATFVEYGNYKAIHLCGDGADKSKEVLTVSNRVYHSVECSARYMIAEAFAKYSTGTVENVAYYTPFYFKSPNITVQKKNILL